MKSPLLIHAKKLLPLMVSVMLLYGLFHHIDFKNTVLIFRSISAVQLLLSVALTALYYATSGIRFAWLSRTVFRISYIDAMALNYLIALATNSVGIFGDVIRVGYLNRLHGVKIRDCITISIADRLLSVWLLALFGSIAMLYILPAPYGLGLFVVGFFLLAIAPILFKKIFPFGYMGELSDLFWKAIHPSSSFLKQFLLTGCSLLCCSTALFLLASSMNLPISFTQLLAFSPVIIISSVIPFTYSGLGAREAILAVLMPLASALNSEQTTALSLLLASCFILSSLVAGIAAILVKRRQLLGIY